MTVTGDRTGMTGRDLRIQVRGAKLMHECWQADIKVECIIGLDVRTLLGAKADVSRPTIILSPKTLALQSGRSVNGLHFYCVFPVTEDPKALYNELHI